jgi:hypothetical protein
MSSMPSGCRYSLAGSRPATCSDTSSSPTWTTRRSPRFSPSALAAETLSHTASSASSAVPAAPDPDSGRQRRGLHLLRAKGVEADQPERLAAPRHARRDLDDRARGGHAVGPCEPCVPGLVEPERRRLHGQVRGAEQAARRVLHLVRGHPIDELDRKPQRDTERDRDDGHRVAADRVPQRSPHGRLEQRGPRLAHWSSDAHREVACRPLRVSS